MTSLADARASLFAAEVGVLPDGRVQRWTPASVAAPAVWIDSAIVTTRAAGNGTVIVATFPIYCVVDGNEAAQVEGLDDLVARAWDAAHGCKNGAPVRAQPQALDVGGPTLRATVIDVDVVLTGRTLCAPT